jgi:hypothetical protein
MAFFPGGWCGYKMKTLIVVGLLLLEYNIEGCVTLEQQQRETLTLCSPNETMHVRERERHTHT